MSSKLASMDKAVASLEKDVDQLRKMIQESNREELAEAARKAKAGVGEWHRLEDI